MSWLSDRTGIHLGPAQIAGLAGTAALGPLGGVVGGVLSAVPGLQSASDFLKGNSGKNLLGLLQGANAAYLQHKSSGLANNALGTQQAIWDSGAPLRTAGQAAMLNPGAGIAAKIAALPNRNPYAVPPASPGTPQLAPVRAA